MQFGPDALSAAERVALLHDGAALDQMSSRRESRANSCVLVCELCVGAPRDDSRFWTRFRSAGNGCDDGARALAHCARAQP